MQNIYLPCIQYLELNHFSLYDKNPVCMDFSKPVSCIMGANGIGKSTLLNCINYAVTGKINPPDKKLKSIEELENDNNYHLDYFDGRISEIDKEYATARVVFTVSNHKLDITRRFYPQNEIINYILDGESQAPSQFSSDIIQFTGLTNFAQFVFLQLKVLTFDERRDCLFWNSSVLTPTIFLCLGQNAADADRADLLAREIQRVGSRVRNLQWEITKQTTRLNTIIDEQKKAFQNVDYTAEEEVWVKNEYEQLVSQREESAEKRLGFINDQQLLYAQTSELSIRLIQLEKEYETTYSKLFSAAVNLSMNPLIMDIQGKGCPICGRIHPSIPERVQNCMDMNICPLCGEAVSIESEPAEDIIQSLELKAQEISDVKAKISEKYMRKEFYEEEIAKLEAFLDNLEQRISQIEGRKYSFLIESEGATWDSRVKAIKDSIKLVEEQKTAESERRDSLKVEYDRLCFSLEKIYQTVQLDFLPIFKKYAKEFTGLNLDMILNPITNDNRRQFKFVLQVDDTNRDNEFELSESQRFFIDIALRMAIVSFVCKDSYASMLIDTPEGSLDIAYETNAGAMFSEYIAANQKMILTANLNSSGLIETLADRSKHEKFELINMLRWAKLSSVQHTRLDLFTEAIAEIESKLEG